MTKYNEYGNALFMLCREDGTEDAIIRDIRCADGVLSENPEYVKLMDTPAISAEEKLKLIDEAFGTLREELVSLIKILTEKRMLHSYRAVFDSFYSSYDEAMGIERVEAVSAVKMTDEQIEKLTEKLHALTGKTIIVKNTVDPAILGGVKLRYGAIQLDGSVKSKLDAFSERLKNIVI